MGTFDEYPMRIEALELEELQLLNERYQNENDDRLCSTLNEYGLTGFSRVLFPNDVNPCLEREIIRIELLNPDSLTAEAKKALLKNKEFTFVSDTSRLVVKEIIPLYGCTICEGPDINSVELEWKITFANQRLTNSEIEGTEITVFIDALGVNRIWGNWYPDFSSGGLINVGFLEAKNIMLDWEIDMESYTGEKEIFIIGEEHLTEDPIFEYLAYRNEGSLELRRTWRVPISHPDNTFQGWNANIDVYEGLLLSVKPILED